MLGRCACFPRYNMWLGGGDSPSCVWNKSLSLKWIWKKLPDELSAPIHPDSYCCITAPEMFLERESRLPGGQLFTYKDFQCTMLRYQDIFGFPTASERCSLCTATLAATKHTSMRQRKLFVEHNYVSADAIFDSFYHATKRLDESRAACISALCDESRFYVKTKWQMSDFLFGVTSDCWRDGKAATLEAKSRSAGWESTWGNCETFFFFTAAAHFASKGVHRRCCTSNLFPPRLVESVCFRWAAALPCLLLWQIQLIFSSGFSFIHEGPK